MEIKFIRNGNPKQKPAEESKLGFGKVFSDHMFVVEYDKGTGWHDARVQPYGPFSIDPASPVLHYGQEIFEGLKSYRNSRDEAFLFRAKDNAERMNKSAERLCMPALDAAFQFEAMNMLVDIEREWIPRSEGTSLYLRPTMLGDGAELGVHAASRYIYYIICSPSGAYYANGMQPIRIHLEDKYVRAVKGGIGFAKTGGNYAASLKAAEEAEKAGFDQVLWLDGKESKYVEEVGAMNMMFVIDGALCTAMLEGSILDGITRRSILQIARDKGMRVEERRIGVQELIDAYEAGKLTEAFGTGTAAVISPVGELEYQGKCMILNKGEIGPVSMDMYNTLTGIQCGKLPDPYGWVTKVEKRTY